MSLLDFYDPDTAGLLGIASSLLRSGGPSPLPIGIGQAIGQAVPEGFQAAQATQLAQQRAQLQAAQMGEYQSIAKWREAEAADLNRKADIQQATIRGLQNAFGPQGAPMPSSPAAGNAVEGVTGIPSGAIGGQGQMPQQGQPSGGNPMLQPEPWLKMGQGIINEGGNPEEALKYVNLGKGMAELQNQGIHLVDTGDRVSIYKAGQGVIGTFPKGMTPKETADLIAKNVDLLQQNAKLAMEGAASQRTTGVAPPQLPQVPNLLGGPQGVPQQQPVMPRSSAPGAPAVGNIPSGGAPKVKNDPRQIYANVPQAAREGMIASEINAATKEIEKEGESLPQLQQLAQSARRYMELNAVVPTGRLSGSKVASEVRAMIPGSEQAKNLQEMKKIEASQQAMAGLMKGQGQVSNMERSILGRASASGDNEKEVNDDINRVIIGASQNQEDRIAFKQWFVNQYQTRNQSDSWWNDYINNNPRYVTGDKNRLVPNDARMDWQTFMTFRQQGARPLPLREGMWGKVDTTQVKPGVKYITPQGVMTWDPKKQKFLSVQ